MVGFFSHSLFIFTHVIKASFRYNESIILFKEHEKIWIKWGKITFTHMSKNAWLVSKYGVEVPPLRRELFRLHLLGLRL